MNAQTYNDRLAAEAYRRRARMAKWRVRKLTLEQIAKKFGITRQKVYWHLKRFDETKGKKRVRRAARSIRR